MDPHQLQAVFVREHDLLAGDIRLFVRTRVDGASDVDTARQRQRILQFIAHIDASSHIFNPADLARLRLSCNEMVTALDNYATQQRDPALDRFSVVQDVPTGGRPRKVIDPDFLTQMSAFRGPKGIGRLLGLSARTVRRQQLDLGIAEPQRPVFLHPPDGPPVRNPETVQSRATLPPLSDPDLDRLVGELMNRFPNHGRSQLHGLLHGMGHNVTRAMVSASMTRITGVPGHFGRVPIRPKKYRVNGPGSLWHHDGQHGLIHWGLVLHAFVDGFSRRVMGLRVSNNNRSATVLRLFQDIVRVFGFPSRVRGDHGVENLGVAELMERIRGLNRGSYIWGPSVHNTRIERMWVDMVAGFVEKWKAFFMDLEANHALDRSDDRHIQVLQHVFLPHINADAMVWADGWNHHRFTRLPRHQHIFRDHLPCPEELYLVGEFENGVRTLPAVEGDLEDDDDIAAYGAGDDDDDEDDENEPRRGVQRLLHHFPEAAAADIPEDQRNPNGWGRPREMFEVRVPEPNGNLSPEFMSALDAHLARSVDLRSQSMDVRRLWWDAALDFLSRNL